MTKEHLWPDWVRKVVVLESRGQKDYLAEIERRGKTKRFANRALEQRVGMPCGRCNHGWMSALENEVKAFAIPMVARGEQVLLDPTRQRALSR